MYHSVQFNGFVKNELDTLLFEDIWNFWIFNESDLHSATYFYIRNYYMKRDSDNSANIYVRCEPKVIGLKPDIVVYERSKPKYIFELKMFVEPDNVNENRFNSDIEKLSNIMNKLQTIKWGFFIVAYDSDVDFTISNQKLRKLGHDNVSIISINLRRKKDSGRRRVGYDDWRYNFDRLRINHNKY